MARVVRADVFDPREISAFHCINRCVRRCFLCGNDPLTGNDYEHRKVWLEERLRFLAGVFGIDVLGFAVMSNHFHVILRNRPDVVATWSDRQVAERWWRLCPCRKNEAGGPEEPKETDLAMITADADRLAEIRLRLSDISWFMRMIAERVARRANAEEQCSGRFWQGRFKAVKLCDEAAILACSVYVDLNPIRAGIAATPEESEHTSATRRIEAFGGDTSTAADWLSPVEVAERGEPGPGASCGAALASDKGFLPLSLAEYLELLDWTGREAARGASGGKRGRIPGHLAPILERVGVPAENWLAVSLGFGKLFRRVAGCAASVARAGVRGELRCFRVPGARLLTGAKVGRRE